MFRLHHPSVTQLRHPDLRKVHGPVLLLGKATGGRAPSINIDSGQTALESASLRSAYGASNGSSRERVVAIFGQFVWALREFRR